MKLANTKASLRCAVYTRVSTEHGLEQEFNSLDNQREASEAYIKSQAHEGWRLMRDRYDDGGFSGGSMDRPALKKLLDAVRARRVDVIVVYSTRLQSSATPQTASASLQWPAGACLRRSLPSRAATPIQASRTCATSPRRTGADGSVSRADASSPSRISPRTRCCRTGRGLRYGSPLMRAARSRSSPASGPVGPRFGRSRRARRQTTSSPSWRITSPSALAGPAQALKWSRTAALLCRGFLDGPQRRVQGGMRRWRAVMAMQMRGMAAIYFVGFHSLAIRCASAI